jgi:hypothetical protein
MAQKNILKILGVPSTRAAFLKDFDGNADALANLQQMVDSIAEEHPDVAQVWDSATRFSGGDMDAIVQNLADSLYTAPDAKRGGIKGKTDAEPERMEGGLPLSESKAEKQTLADLTPEQREIINRNEEQAAARADAMEKAKGSSAAPAKRVSISPAARKYAADKGVDLATVTGSGKNGAITKGDIDKAMSGGETEAATTEQAAAPAPKAPEDDLSDLPVPGGMGMTRDEVDALSDPLPGGMGLTRQDVANYMPHVQNSMDTMGSESVETSPRMSAEEELAALLGEPLMPMPGARAAATPVQPPQKSAMDMSRLSAAARQQMPQPQPRSAMDLERLSAAARQPRINLSGEQPGVLRGLTSDDMSFVEGGQSITDLPGPGTGSQTGGGSPPTDTNKTPPKTPPFRPITSMKDKFFEKMGIPGAAGGWNMLTVPADIGLKYGVPSYLLYQGARAASNYAMPGEQNNTAPPEVMQQLDDDIARKKAEFESHFGKMRPAQQMPNGGQ